MRGDGCKILKRLWDAIGWPEDTEERPLGGTSGGYQVHFVPGLVEEVLSLCLSSSHDAMRAVGVHMLHSMIVSEVSVGLRLLDLF
jgi:dedicator of cytokinesis protein 3